MLYTNLYLLLAEITFSFAIRPIVLWHGLGDSCCDEISLMPDINALRQNFPGVYVKSLYITQSNNEAHDSFYMDANKQVHMACEQIASDPLLSGGYDAIGFSQGAQLLRAVVQRCPSPKMYNLISFGGQHQGIYGLPEFWCGINIKIICDRLKPFVKTSAYFRLLQDHIVPLQYWHDPLHEEKYRLKNTFLADINNEKVFKSSYRTNLMSLSNFVLVKFERDNVVVPRESQWFGFFTPGQAVEITKLEDSDLYKKDLLGLKEMNEAGKLHFISLPGDHLEMDVNSLINIVKLYLK